MAKEVIDKIRSAEVDGENAERKAREDAEILIAKTRDDAKREAAERISAARKEASAAAADSAELTNRMLFEAQESAWESTQELRNLAASRKNKAVGAIIEKIMKD